MKANLSKKLQSLKAKIIVMMASLVIISNVILGMIAFNTARPALEKSIGQNLTEITSNVSNKLIAQNERIFEVLEAVAEISAMKDENTSMLKKNAILADVKRADKSFVNIAFYDKNGNVLTDEGNKVNLSSAEYFQEAMKGSRFIRDPEISSVNNQLLMFYSVPVKSSNGAIIGVLVAVVDGKSLSEFCAETVIGNGNHPIIINQKTGRTIGDSDPKYVEKGQVLVQAVKTGGMHDGIEAAMNGQSGTSIFFEARRKTVMIAAYRPVGGGTNWLIFCMTPRKEYLGSIDAMMLIMLFTSLAIIAVALVLGYIIVHLSIMPLRKVKENINEIATGNADLTKRISVSSKDEVGEVVSGFNKFTEKLQTIVSGVKNSKNTLMQAGEDMDASAQDTADSIAQILENISHVHKQISSQSESVNQTASAMNEIMANVESFEKMMTSQSENVSQASSAVEQMIGNIASVNSSVEKMAESFGELQSDAQNGARKQEAVNEKITHIESQSELLQEANKAIASIASQTNLLAMNAAIEAAHAGDAGKGFSVVADEIRKLSETSSQQSKTIGEQLGSIRESIKTVVSASGESSAAFLNVSDKIRGTDELVRQIKNAMDEQNAGSRQIIDALKQMNDSTLEVKSASSEMSAGNKAIMKEILNLQSATGEMKDSMDNMSASARKIDETGAALGEITKKMGESIDEIGKQIDQFKV